MSLFGPMKFGEQPVTPWTPSVIEFILIVTTWPLGITIWVACSLIRKYWLPQELTVRK